MFRYGAFPRFLYFVREARQVNSIAFCGLMAIVIEPRCRTRAIGGESSVQSGSDLVEAVAAQTFNNSAMVGAMDVWLAELEFGKSGYEFMANKIVR
jgi:hypothetical protein